MAEDKVKLTVRLPAQLHQVLKEHAVEYNVSLNQAVVDTLTVKLMPAPAETEREKVRRMLKTEGKLADTRWMRNVLPGVKPATLDEARAWLRGVPLSEWIIEDRGPR